MELKIIEDGVRIDGVKQEIGTTITVPGDAVPPSLIGKVAEHGERVLVTNPAPEKPANEPKALKGPFTIGESSPGWFAVLDADGNPVKKLRKADSDAFLTLTPDDQLAFLAD